MITLMEAKWWWNEDVLHRMNVPHLRICDATKWCELTDDEREMVRLHVEDLKNEG